MLRSPFTNTHHLVHRIMSLAGVHCLHNIFANSFQLLIRQITARSLSVNKALALCKLFFVLVCKSKRRQQQN